MKTISDKFLVGAMYAPFCRTRHAPIEEWERDIQWMADLGYTCLHGFAEWHDIEYEKGKFDFSKVDHLVECCAKAGIVPIINVATQNGVGFYSPRWLMEELRGCDGYVDADGRRPYHSEYVVPCLDDPAYQKYAHRFLAEVAKHFGNDTRVGGYVLWGEPTMNNYITGARICYCTHTLKKFRAFLAQKYQNIENLNECWGSEGPSCYDSFDAVYPPTGHGRHRGGFCSWDDFCEFMEQNLAGHIIEADRIFKENGALQPTITEMLPGIANNIDSWKLAKTSDIVGISLFGKPKRTTSLFMSVSSSLAKAEGKSTFVIEAGGGSIKFDNPQLSYAPQVFTPSAEELKTTVLMRAGFGVRGVMFWCWRPRLSDLEGNDYGMCRPDGKPLKRTRELGKLARRMLELSDVYFSSHRKSEVAIYMSQKIQHLATADRMDGCYTNALIGANTMLTDMHVNSDFITDEGILDGALGKYKVLLLPCSYILSAETAEKIAEFVKNGGRVIADYILAQKMPGGFCYTELPGGGLSKVFGIEHEDVLAIAHKTMERENTFGVAKGDFVEELVLTDARSVSESYGEGYPLLTENQYGKGYANYIATQFFSRYAENPLRIKREKLLALLKASGVVPYASIVGEDEKDLSALVTSALMREDGALRVFTVSNTDYEPIKDKVMLPKGKYASVEENARVSFCETEDGVIASFELAAYESIALYTVEKK
jgi:beta-galactosidase GanA